MRCIRIFAKHVMAFDQNELGRTFNYIWTMLITHYLLLESIWFANWKGIQKQNRSACVTLSLRLQYQYHPRWITPHVELRAKREWTWVCLEKWTFSIQIRCKIVFILFLPPALHWVDRDLATVLPLKIKSQQFNYIVFNFGMTVCDFVLDLPPSVLMWRFYLS